MQTCCLIKTALLFGLGKKLSWVNLGLGGKGIAMSSCIGQAMHYTVAFPQSCEFEIYKCHTLFSPRKDYCGRNGSFQTPMTLNHFSGH